MKFDYQHEFQHAFQPGTRVWVSGFSVSSDGHRIDVNQKPMLTEICVCNKQEDEAKLRKAGGLPRYIVPVDNNGNLQFSKAIAYSISRPVFFVKTKEEAEKCYQKELLRAYSSVNTGINLLHHTKDLIQGLIDETNQKLLDETKE